jgi:uncharacterized protein YdhG (YjbR/CyaY superfamily)
VAAGAHDSYLANCDEAARARLLAIREVIEGAVPGTTRTMAYQMPALRKGRVVAYFATFKHHIGIYPPVTAPPELVAELAVYAGPKGNLIFPHKAELPLDLIRRVGAALAGQDGMD